MASQKIGGTSAIGQVDSIITDGHRPEVILKNAGDLDFTGASFTVPASIDQGAAGAEDWPVEQGAAGTDPWPTKDAGAYWTAAHKIVNSADMTTPASVTDAPTTDQKLVLTDLIVSVETATNVTLKEETSGTVLGGPYYLPDNGTLQLTTRSRQFKVPTANKKIQAVAADAVNITVETWCFSEA